MERMRATVFHGVNDISVEEVERPRAGVGEAVIRVTLTTIYGGETMPGRCFKRRVAIASDRRIQPTVQETLDPAIIEPDTLRDRIYEGLSMLPPDKRAALRDRILAGINEGGGNIGTSLLMLGIPAKTPAELTPSDIAKLVRYIRLNAPQVLIFLITPLSELLPAANSVSRVKQSRRAA